VRASRRPGMGAEAKRRRKGRQVQMISAMIAAEAPDLSHDEHRRVAAVIHQLVGADTWLSMRDDWGFTDDECIRAVHEAFDTIVAKLRRDQQHAKKTKR
jgi:hypothetical protein